MDPIQWQKEQERVNSLREELQARITRDEPLISELKTQVVGIRTDFWEDVTVNLTAGDDRLETAISMKQQAEILSERERSHRHLNTGLLKMRRLLPAPYFGRIDFKEEEQDGPSEPIYIGVASFLSDDGETFLVYDWRTPVASLYYDYGPGPARYGTPGGEIAGEMTLKRQFSIRDGVIRSMFNTGMTIGDELLQEVLSRSSSSGMQSIVGTIQQEQNAIIRNDRARMLIVQGAAGSGKTSAALQRVAYLLYKHRNRITAQQMVLFSPNPMFSSYISSVLPELGEENIRQTTFQDYLERRLGKRYKLEDMNEQLEAVLAASSSDEAVRQRMLSIRFKNSIGFLELIHAYGDRLLNSGIRFKGFRFRGRLLLARKQLEDRFYSMEGHIRLPNRIELLREWLLEELTRLEQEELGAEWVREEIEFLDNDQYMRVHKAMQRKLRKGIEEDESTLEENLLRAEIVRKAFKPLRRLADGLAWIDVANMYRDLFQENEPSCEEPSDWQAICRMTHVAFEEKRLPYEDAAPLLYLTELVQGFRMNTSIRYVLIDEAQDFSPFQFHFLQKLFPMAKVTALGDFNQAIFAHSTELAASNWLAELYGPEQTDTIVLKRSYRSTRQIVEFTRSMLPDESGIEPFDRPGELPLLYLASDERERDTLLAKDLHELMASGTPSIAVICQTSREAQEAWEKLRRHSGLEELKLVTKDTTSFQSGAVVIPAYLAKGVEFDAVLIYEASSAVYGEERHRKLFYTACTRAMHKLRLYCTGEPSPFVTGAAADSWQEFNHART
ncbi:helicase [Paenibacillus herberti]|uniref:Helicase n=1 Tax=Paenibacillus herberti TaxID=1619309 RepID=A0A229P5B9_9BACL|nr:RNA polymerase recycling motor HelD [Paenibacillus herberti]OXM17486.1 helicase [Paenibacillus herberti]